MPVIFGTLGVVAKNLIAKNGVKLLIGGLTIVTTALTDWHSEKTLNNTINKVISDKQLEERLSVLEDILLQKTEEP